MERMLFPVTRREAERVGIAYSSEANKNALFPSQLRELRKEKGVSQDALSKVLGVSKSTIGLWETGDTLPDAKSLYDLARYFDVSSDYLLGLSKAKKQEFHNFTELTRFYPSTIDHLMHIAGSNFSQEDEEKYPDLKRTRISFEYLLDSIEFSRILEDLCGYLDMSIAQGPINADVYIGLDKHVREISDNNLCVVSTGLMAQTFLSNAQKHIANAFSAVKTAIRRDGGWKQYLGYK